MALGLVSVTMHTPGKRCMVCMVSACPVDAFVRHTSVLGSDVIASELLKRLLNLAAVMQDAPKSLGTG